MTGAILALLGAVVGWLAIQSMRLSAAESKVITSEEAKKDAELYKKIHSLDDDALNRKLADDFPKPPKI